jgi:hypothetical protein
MIILGISGRKQSGKSTTGNFIYSVYMSNMGIADNVYINESGQIMVSDLLGDKNYAGIFDPTYTNNNDFVVKQVFDRLSANIRLYNFADVLKQDICMNLLNLTYDQCYGSDEDKNQLTDIKINGTYASARDILQYIGTDVFRNMKPNVWVDATIERIKKDKPKIALITDCRFPNEIEAIKNNGGKVLRLTRDPHHSTHESESILDMLRYDWNNFDFILDNKDMSLFDQISHIKDILSSILDV